MTSTKKGLWPSLVAQTVKELPAMWQTWIQSLGWDDPLEKEQIMWYVNYLDKVVF